MEKLPTRDEIIKSQKTESQQSEASVLKSSNDSALLISKEAADIAANKDKQVESEIKTKLRIQGYISLEEGLKDIEGKHQDANKMLQSAREIEESAIQIRDEAEREKQKAIHAFEVIKQREATINARLERAITTEKGFDNKDAKYNALRQELQELIDYHQKNIRPCVKALKLVASAIYSWIDLLNGTKADFSVLYNYIGKVMKVIDKYTDMMPSSISHDIIIAEDRENET